MTLKLCKSPIKQIIITSDFHYDLFYGGYIKPVELLDDESARKVNNAVAIIKEFEELLLDNNIMDYN